MPFHLQADSRAPHSLFLKLESRLVFDAAAGATIVAADDSTNESSQPIPADDGVDGGGDVLAPVGQGSGLQVVFIDAAVAQVDVLAAAIPPGAIVVNLDASRDGVGQISEWLHEHGNVASVHIISHGSEGRIHLGNAELSVETLSHYSTQLVGWRDALTLDADVLIYGCDVAANGNELLLNSLALYTGADVAASIDATGSAALGGDWDLEMKTGEIQVAGIVADSYEGLLATGGPTPSLTPAKTTLNAGEKIQITLDVDSGTTANTSLGSGWGLSATEITASAGTISNLQYSGANGIYTFDYTAASSGGSVTISVAADAYKTGSGPTTSLGNQATSLSLTVVQDSTAPSISSLAIPGGGADSTFIAGDNVDVTVSFDESVNVVTTGGTPYITLNVGGVNKTGSYLSGTGTSTLTFRYTVAAGDTDNDGISIGANSLTLNGGTIKDGAGNAATTTFAAVAAASAAKVDTTAPTATIVFADTALKAGESSLVTITFSEAVTGFANADVTAPNGTLSTFSSADGGLTWAATYTPNADVEDATNQIALATTYTDAGGNAGTAANSANFAIDTKLPTVSVADNVAGTVNAATSSITYTYTFSEAVSGLTAGDFVVTDGTISSVSGAGTTWTVVVTPAAGVASGNIMLDLAEDAVVDAAGNGNAYYHQEIQAIDTAAPSAPAVSSQITTDTTPLIAGTATVGSGETLTVTVAGVTYTEGDGNLTRTGSNWSLQIPSTQLVGGVSEPYALLPGSYSVTAAVTDAALNAASDATTGELVVQFSFGGATVYFDTVYKGVLQGDGISSPTLEANDILISEKLTALSGSKFFFTSLTSATTFSGNNVLGSLVYTDASGTEHVISGEMSRIFKSGSTLEGFYFYVNNGTASTADDAAYVIVAPGQEGVFGLANVESTSSDLVDAKLNSLLAAQPPMMSVADVSVNEGAGTATVTITLSKAYGSAITVDYATSDGTAVSGNDYTAKTGSLIFAAGETSKTFTVAITNDVIYEPTQQFRVTLSNALAGAVPVLLADATADVSILDDDAIPTVSVNNVTVSESSPWAVFTVSLSNASASAVSFTPVLSAAGATATLTGAGADVGSTLQYYDAVLGWTNVTGPLTIAAGQTSVLVRASVNTDSLFEGSETFKLSTGAITGTVTNSGPAVGTGTIKDDGSSSNVFLDAATSGTATAGTADDDRPSVTLLGAVETSPGVFEAAGTSYHEDDGYAVFTVQLGNASSFDTTLDFALASGTAIHEGGDFGAATGSGTPNLEVSTDGGLTWVEASSATITAGSTSVLVRTPLVDDGTLESREKFTLTVNVTSSPLLVANTEAAATAYIIDDEGEPTITVNNVTYNEAAGTATFTVTLSVPVAGAVSVDWATSNGTAIAGSDYTAASGMLTFAAGETTKTVTVAITNDSIYEISENFFITLSNVVSGPYSTTVSVADDRGGPLTSGNSQTIDLVASGGLVSGIQSGGGTITLATDFQQSPFPKTGLDIVSGESATAMTSAEAEVTATLWIDGRIFVLVDARDAGTAWTYNATSGQLESEVSFDDARELVLAGGMTFRDYVNGVAGAGTLGGTLTAYLAANATEAGDTWTFAYDDNNGGNLQARKVDFTLSFDGGSSVSLGAPGTGTIKDDGTGNGGTNNDRPTLSVNDVVYNEAAGTVTFTVTMSNASAVTATIDYSTANRSPVSALAGADYTATSGTLTIAPGSLGGTVSVTIANDALYEVSESFLLNLSNPSNATVLDGQGVATIKDDGTGIGGSNNDRPQIVVNDVDYNEAAGFVVFTVSLSNPSAIGAVGFDLSTVDGSATGAGVDFGAVGGQNLQISLDNGVTWTDATSAEIPALATSVLVRMPLLNDTPFEIAETFNLRLSNLQGDALFSKVIGIATIRDDGTGLGGTDNDAPVIVPVAADPPQQQVFASDPIKPVNEPKPVSDGLKGEVESADLIILPSIANQGTGSASTYQSGNGSQVQSGLSAANSGTGFAPQSAGESLLMSASNSGAGSGGFADPSGSAAPVPATPTPADPAGVTEEFTPQAEANGETLASSFTGSEDPGLWAEVNSIRSEQAVAAFIADGKGFSAALAFERARFDREAAAMLAAVNAIEAARQVGIAA